jgi:predicted ABC-type transport system involved in lysophospholipase L1 biosynthesis ATPase subunit
MADMTKPLLALAEVTKHYDSGAGKVDVLAGVNLTVAAGESLAIVGPSGCGKSTLLNIVGTLDRPDSGRVELAGQDLTRLDEVALAGVRNREIGFVFQSHHLLPQCTVLENVLVPTLPLEDVALRDSAPSRARQLLERVGLGDRLGHRPGQLSGGERQRVAVVRALINRPKLVLADEPTGALDRTSATSLGDLLVRLNVDEGVSLIVVTHALDLAKRLQKVFELRDGALHELVDSH